MFKGLLTALVLFVGMHAQAAEPAYEGTTVSTATGKATKRLNGVFYIGASSPTWNAPQSTPTITLDGGSGSVRASSGTFTYGLTAATGSFTYASVSSMNVSGANQLLKAGTGNYTTGVYGRYFGTGSGMYVWNNEANALANGTTGRGVSISYGGLDLGTDSMVGFYNGTDPAATSKDIGLSRIGAGVLGVGTGAAGSVAGILNAGGVNISSGGIYAQGTSVGMYLRNNAALTVKLESGGGADSAIWHTDGTNNAYVGMQGGSGCGTGSWSVYNAGCRLNVTPGGKVGVLAVNPATTLDVNGDAQFGSGATKSTFTTTGALTTAGGVYVSTPSGNGNLRVRAGNGNGGGTPSIRLYQWFGSSNTAVGDTGGADWDMLAHKFTVPANTLVNNGDQLRVYAVALATTTNQTKGLYCYFNGDEIERNFNDTTNELFYQDNTVWRTSATTMRGRALKMRSSDGGSITTVHQHDPSITFDATAAFDIECYIRNEGTLNTGVDVDMDFIKMEVWLDPAP